MLEKQCTNTLFGLIKCGMCARACVCLCLDIYYGLEVEDLKLGDLIVMLFVILSFYAMSRLYHERSKKTVQHEIAAFYLVIRFNIWSVESNVNRFYPIQIPRTFIALSNRGFFFGFFLLFLCVLRSLMSDPLIELSINPIRADL